MRLRRLARLRATTSLRSGLRLNMRGKIADSSNTFASAFGAAESEYDEPVDGFNEPADDFDMGDDAPEGTRGVKGGDAR